MSRETSIVCLSVSPSLKRFYQPLLEYISQQSVVATWAYRQGQDEPSSIDVALDLLTEYLDTLTTPVHLIGHGTSGLLGLLYARKYPHKVTSLTLLSVGVYPAIDWRIHYYFRQSFFPCSRKIVLAQTAKYLFDYDEPHINDRLVEILEQDLATSLSLHSPMNCLYVPPGELPVPTLVCGGGNDFVIGPTALEGWRDYLKKGDRLWECKEGKHFFHFFYPEQLSKQIFAFWQSLSLSPVA